MGYGRCVRRGEKRLIHLEALQEAIAVLQGQRVRGRGIQCRASTSIGQEQVCSIIDRIWV